MVAGNPHLSCMLGFVADIALFSENQLFVNYLLWLSLSCSEPIYIAFAVLYGKYWQFAIMNEMDVFLLQKQVKGRDRELGLL